jgi:Xaa-Pro aminopeptidase
MKNLIRLLIVIMVSGYFPESGAAQITPQRLGHIDNILPEKERAEVVNRILEWRLDNIIPDLLNRENIDMWIIMCRETNEDPVFWSMLPEPLFHARRTTVLIFHRKDDGSVERLSCGGNMGKWFRGTWKDKSKTQFESLAGLIADLDPKSIGINISPVHRSADGLSKSLYDIFTGELPEKYLDRLVSAENLCIGWLETRSPEELSIYPHLCGIAHELIAEFYSNGVITPEITTTKDVEWWIRDRITSLGLETWFSPSIDVQRHPDLESKYQDNPDVIRRGDLIHCDVGIKYLRLCTDMQWHAYVCHIGEQDAPEGLKNALGNAVRLGEMLMDGFEAGLTGNQIGRNVTEEALNDGLRPVLYSHPIGFYGHSAGTSVDTRPMESQPPGFTQVMEYPMQYNTVYAIEYGCTTSVPEWKGQDVYISYEEQGVFTEKGCSWVDGNQTEFYLIR